MPDRLRTVLLSLMCVMPACLLAEDSVMDSTPLVVAHRGLLKHAPENTLSNFRACLELRLGFEVDVRRSKDGQLVCVHDDTVDRTTNGRGAVSALTLAELKQLDAGWWFGLTFREERIPTFDEVMSVVQKHAHRPVIIAIDLKTPDIETACVRAVEANAVFTQVLFIGTAINDPSVRRKLREANPTTHVACLAQTAKDLPAALVDKDSDWAYLRFVPSREDIERIHEAGKKAFIAGPTVVGIERANWQAARLAGVDGILTDYPLDLADDLRATTADHWFERIGSRYLGESPKLSPISATTFGDHRFDHMVDDVSDAARTTQREFLRRYLSQLEKFEPEKLSRENQVDLQLLRQHLRGELWSLDELQEWAWNPVVYTQLTGGAVYGLMAREFAPIEQRLMSVTYRLEKLPKLYEQIRGTLDAKRVPPIHAETAVKQNRGLISILDNMVKPQMSWLGEADRARLNQAITTATDAVEQHQKWLEKELLPNAKGNFRIGAKLFDAKLAFSLGSGLSRPDIRDRAEFELRRVRAEMYSVARGVMLKADPKREREASARRGSPDPAVRATEGLPIGEKKLDTQKDGDRRSEQRRGQETRAERERESQVTRAERDEIDLPEKPTPEQQQKIIAAALEKAYAEIPPRDGIVDFAKKSLEMTTEFVRQRDLVTIPNDPLEIILMPEFQRGVSIAYCDSPGPLDVGQKTYYAVSPIPTEWTDKQVGSFLREYNLRSIHDLTIHEAMPGHFLQLAHSNRSPRRLRALLSSGTFVEGWGVYSEQLMSEEGFLDRDPLMRLVALKWYLRGIANAIIDQAIHVDGMNRDDAIKLMVHDTFQEEREAALKWVRAQLTSTQLSTYFVGYQEHRDLRTAAEKAWADKFSLKRYHDGTLSFGSPPVRFVKALLLDEPIPE